MLQVFADRATARLVADITATKKMTPCRKRPVCYTVRKEGGMWKILTVTAVKSPFTGPERKRKGPMRVHGCASGVLLLRLCSRLPDAISQEIASLRAKILILHQ